MPLRNASGMSMNTDELYHKIMHVYRWGNMNKKGIFVDYNNSLTLAVVLNVRQMHATLAEALLDEGKNDLAVDVLDSAMVRIPDYNFPLNISVQQNELAVMNIIQLYYRAKQTEKAKALADEFIDLTEKNIAFFAKLPDAQYDLQLNLYYLHQLEDVLKPYDAEFSELDGQQTDFYLQKMGYSE
jgi:tetratricopeptide (TPR) repeat protein